MKVRFLMLLCLVAGCVSTNPKMLGRNFIISISPREHAAPIGQEAVFDIHVQFDLIDTSSQISATKVSLRLSQNEGLEVLFEPPEFRLGMPNNGVMKVKPDPSLSKNAYTFMVEGVDEFGNVRESNRATLVVGKPKTLGGNFTIKASPPEVAIHRGQEAIFNVSAELDPVDESTHISASRIRLRTGGNEGVVESFEPVELSAANSFTGILRIKTGPNTSKKGLYFSIEGEDEFGKTRLTDHPLILTIR